MSASGRATEFMRAWGEGHNKPHNPGCKQWGADDCDACVTEAFDPWEALMHAAWIMGWPGRPPVRQGRQNSDPAGSDTGVADSDRGDSSGTNLRPGGEPSPSRQGRARGELDYGLLMPFVACVSQGGPYDDSAFVAGVRLQSVWHALEGKPAKHQAYVHPDLVPQLDLVAMHFGYTLTSERHSDGWTLCIFATS